MQTLQNPGSSSLTISHSFKKAEQSGGPQQLISLSKCSVCPANTWNWSIAVITQHHCFPIPLLKGALADFEGASKGICNIIRKYQ